MKIEIKAEYDVGRCGVSEKTIRMPKELLDKWLGALRSGAYTQACGVMYDDIGGYCCLGVLQHVACGEIVGAEEEELPDVDWLREHRITFGTPGRANNPFLPTLGAAAPYEGGSHKLLSDNRALYIDQSARTVSGKRAEFGKQYASEQSPQEPIPSYASRRG